LKILFAAVAAILLTACGGHGQTSGEVTASPSATMAPAGSEGQASAAPSPGATISGTGTSAETAAPSATPTANANLLVGANGTIVRRYPAAYFDAYTADIDGFVDRGNGADFVKPASGPVAFVWELPGVATLSGVTVGLEGTSSNHGRALDFAVSTEGPDNGYRDLGTLAPEPDPTTKPIPGVTGVRARWFRVSWTANGDTVTPFDTIVATGSLAPRPANAPQFAGVYYALANPNTAWVEYADGTLVTRPPGADPWHLIVVQPAPGSINAQLCANDSLHRAFPGTINGRSWTWATQDSQATVVINDEGNLIVGKDSSNHAVAFERAPDTPAGCKPEILGKGPTNVLILDQWHQYDFYPLHQPGGPVDPAHLAPGFRFTRIPAATLDQEYLNSTGMVIMNALCWASDYLTAPQGAALVRWVAAGHKLLMIESDGCGGKTEHAFLPYDFVTDNPGAQGASSHRLIEVENDSLGSLIQSDRDHFMDPKAYLSYHTDLGDADTVKTQDPHWCGHMFGTNVNNVNGFMQMYALYGKGLIIYDGFDMDDGNIPGYDRLRNLELSQPIPADLPCQQKVAASLILQPSQEGKFVPGKAATLRFPMELLANQGWKGHVDVATTGDFKAAVTPSSADLAGGTQPLTVAVSIPANAKPGTYAVIVNGNGEGGQVAQATIELSAAMSIAKELKVQRRIRIYGIHFDVDKATIKPQSEPVIAQIAAIMKENPTWRFRVEGHTDSDGGYQHNVVLSQHRAEAVVRDLITRYHIAASRLVAMGYSYSRPVAPNTTPAGKALNRRVELYRL
jgi:outer membrane protein OmpA-like peptidoglycan-associated protein